MEVRTILWPTDLSRNSLKAVPHVSSLAEKYQARVVVLYVGADLTTLGRAYGYPNEDHLKHFQEFELKHAKEKLEQVCQKDLKACPLLDLRVVQGDAAAEILKAVQAEKADMVVISTHGRTADDADAASPEFGSVARKIISASPVPVHLVSSRQ
uniref:Universal stress protein n=1 Tax=Desulfobacca acetoxidans TaxID=60893 RepID=A0A7V4LCL5_9BACT